MGKLFAALCVIGFICIALIARSQYQDRLAYRNSLNTDLFTAQETAMSCNTTATLAVKMSTANYIQGQGTSFTLAQHSEKLQTISDRVTQLENAEEMKGTTCLAIANDIDDSVIIKCPKNWTFD